MGMDYKRRLKFKAADLILGPFEVTFTGSKATPAQAKKWLRLRVVDAMSDGMADAMSARRKKAS